MQSPGSSLDSRLASLAAQDTAAALVKAQQQRGQVQSVICPMPHEFFFPHTKHYQLLYNSCTAFSSSPPLYTSLLFSVRFSKPIKHGETLEQKQTQQVQRHVSTALLLLLTFFWSNHSSVGACPMNECCSALQQ